MRQDLQRVYFLAGTWLAELRAQIVGTGDRRVARESNVSEIAALLGDILDEGRWVKAAAGYINVEDSIPCRYFKWNCQVFAYFGSR